MTARKKTTAKVASIAAGEDLASCTQDQLCNFMKRLAPNHPLTPPPWANPSPRAHWLEEFYDHYKELYEAVVQLEGWVLCDTPAHKPQPIIANTCKASGSNPPQRSGSPPPPPFP